MSRAASFAAVLGALNAAHTVGDHIAQTDHQAARKAAPRGWVGPMAGHVGGYTAVQVAALAALRPLGVRPSWARLVAGVVFSAATHALLDRRWPVWKILDLTGSRQFALSRVQAERALLVCDNVDDDPDGPTNLEEAGHALAAALTRAQVGAYREAGEALAHAVRHAVAVIDPEHPTPLHGPYLADQALHHGCLFVAALIIAGGR